MAFRLCIVLLCFLPLFPLQGRLSEVRSALCAYTATSDLDELLILHQGKPFYQYVKATCKKQYDLREMTCPIVATAFLFLQEEGKIPCLDVSLRFLPIENLQLTPDQSLLDLLQQCMWVCDSHVKPWRALIALFERLAGMPLQNYLELKLFKPLAIKNIFWQLSQDCGEMPRLIMAASDLAKVSDFLITGGKWQGHQLLKSSSVALLWSVCQQKDPFFGLAWHIQYDDLALWWDASLLDTYRCKGVAPSLLKSLSDLNGRVIHCSGLLESPQKIAIRSTDAYYLLGGEQGVSQLVSEVKNMQLPLARFNKGTLHAAFCRAGASQQWIIMPRQKIVAIALKANPWSPSALYEIDPLLSLLNAIAVECGTLD